MTELVADLILRGRQIADWRLLHVLEPQLRQALHDGRLVDIAGFHALLLPLGAAEQRAIVEREAGVLGSVPHRQSHHAHASNLHALHIAILRGSANSNTARLQALLSLDKRQLPPRLFTMELDPADATRLDASTASAQHTPAGHLRDDELANRLARFHIVVDASGHTRGHRLPVLARRPAPVATSVLGFPSSYGGHRLVDYLTVDRHVCDPLPRASRCSSAAERLSLLPASYQVSPHGGAGWLPGSLRLRAGRGRTAALDEARGLLGSTTRVVRWHPSSFELWAAIARLCRPHAALVLLAEDVGVQRRVGAAWASLGLSTRRLHFWRFDADKGRHLARHAQLSACLDSTPLYGAHTTAADCLGAALPLLTLPAEGWATRVGGSLLRAVGAPQTAVRSAKGFVDTFSRLATATASDSRVQVARTHEAARADEARRWERRLRRALPLTVDAAPPSGALGFVSSVLAVPVGTRRKGGR